MPLEREIEEILDRAGPLERPRPWWTRLRPRPPRPRLPSPGALALSGVVLLLSGLVYGRFARAAGFALVLAGLVLLVAAYGASLRRRRSGPRPAGPVWRGKVISYGDREPWWRRWRRPRR